MKISQAVRLSVEAGLPDYLWKKMLDKAAEDAHRQNESFAMCSGPVARADFFVMWHREHSKKVMS